MIPVSSEVLRDEADTARAILAKWVAKIDDGIPGIDLPATELDTDAWLHQLCGELMVVSGKCETLASILAGDRFA